MQFLITGLIIAGAAWGLGATPKAAFVIGAGLALSSTAIVLQLLSERGEVATKLGRVGFSVLLLQDLAVIPLLVVAAAAAWAFAVMALFGWNATLLTSAMLPLIT